MVFLLALPTWGQERIPAPGPLRQFDANRDGKLDLKEQRAAASVLLRLADQDGDGRLAEPELRRVFDLLLAQPGLGRLALMFDENGDGRLNPGEREEAYSVFKSHLAALQ